MIKKIIIILTFPLLLIGTSRFCHKATQGFRISKITANFSSNPNWDIAPLSFSEQQKVNDLLNQKFTYLGRGFQSFVFLSADRKYVLKLFNNAYQWRTTLVKLIPSFSLCEKWCAKKINTYSLKLEKTFNSYKIAYEKLKEHTGLIYIHLNKTDSLNKKLTIIDRLGIEHTILLDNTAFLVQKKAELVYSKIDHLMQDGRINEAKAVISNLLQLIRTRCQMGIADSDALIRTNFGFIEDRAIQIDVGPFSEDPRMQNAEVYIAEINRISTSLKHWLENNHPELAVFLKQQLEFE